MKNQFMVMFVLQGLVYGLNHPNVNRNKESKIYDWIIALCETFQNNNNTELLTESKHLSLETYVTNQSSKSVDFFASLSRHISENDGRYTVSLRSYLAEDFLHYESHSYFENIRKVKLEIGYRFVLLNNDTIDVIFNSAFGWNNEQHTFIIFESDDDNDNDKMSKNFIDFMGKILKRIWEKFGVHNVFFPSYRTGNISYAWMYHPFFKEDNHSDYGKMTEVELSDEFICSFHVFKNFNGYEINVGLFHSPPSAPRFNYDGTNIEDPAVEDFYGVDGHLLGTFVKHFNMTVKIRGPSDGIEYGFVEANGTYTGTLADVANGRVSVSFNSQYIKKYSPIGKPAAVLEFSTPVDNDRVCIVVPSPGEIPRWLRLYHSFHPAIWACFAMSMIVSSLFWRIIQYSYTDKPLGYHEVLLATFLIFVGAPVKLQNVRAERILAAAMLFLGMIIMAVLTGTIYDSFTVEMFYPAINTLEELDRNGLNIGTSALSLIDIFGLDETAAANERSVIGRLQHKIKYTPYNPAMPSINKTAHFRNIASITRLSTFAVAKHEYVDEKGRSLLHLVKDCPQIYHLGYILPKHSYLRRPLDHMILKLQQGGFIKLWRIRAIRTLIYQQTKIHQSDNKLKEPVPFTVTDMQTCFMILGFGLGISSCVFVGEIIFKPGNCSRKRGKRVRRGHWF